MEKTTKKRLAAEWLHSCSGCEMSLLNTGAELLQLVKKLDIVHLPLLMDNKGSAGGEQELPEAEIGLLSGAIATDEHLKTAQAMRGKCKILIGLGTCATHGGIPALANQWPPEQWLAAVFSTPSTDESTVPDQDLPVFLNRVHALDEKIKVDILVPGCPPEPGVVLEVLDRVLLGREVELPRCSVCDTCPTRRRGKGAMQEQRRFLANSEYSADQPLEAMTCLLEQGLMCMGPVTAAGCAHDGAPGCIAARVPCRGCFGPVRPGGNQLLDMMNALASHGMDITTIPDRRSLLRFSGAHGRIRT